MRFLLTEKKSKRVPARLRYKVEKKVRDHHRKQKKDAKKARSSGIFKRKDKALGIPSNVPFKEQIIQEAKQMKDRVKERKKLLKGLLKGDAKMTKLCNEPVASTSFQKGRKNRINRNKLNKDKQPVSASAASVAQKTTPAAATSNDDTMQCEWMWS